MKLGGGHSMAGDVGLLRFDHRLGLSQTDFADCPLVFLYVSVFAELLVYGLEIGMKCVEICVCMY